jgi:septum formation protein
MPSLTDEDNERTDLLPEELAVHHARIKAQDVAARSGTGTIVLGADTIVVLDGKILGKPRDKTQACEMLGQLSGKAHAVVTGVAVVRDTEQWCDFESTKVIFRHLLPEEILRYAESGEPMDKAGAYAIQGRGALLVDRIEGCYSNVVGLPLALASRVLLKAGVRLL